jgi:hypothetical protein
LIFGNLLNATCAIFLVISPKARTAVALLVEKDRV